MHKGTENLIPTNRRSKEEARALGAKGGRASGRARRQKRALRLALKSAMALSLDELPDDLRAGIMQAAKVKDEKLLISDAVLGSLIRTACNGNSQMMRLILETLGETSEARLKERELKLKEKLAANGLEDGGSVTIIDDVSDIAADEEGEHSNEDNSLIQPGRE